MLYRNDEDNNVYCRVTPDGVEQYWSIFNECWTNLNDRFMMLHKTDIKLSYESTWCEPYEGMED